MKKAIKDLTPEERAEHVLRRRLAKERRTYGLIGKVSKAEYLGDDEGYHAFAVTFDDGQFGVFEVRLYAKSAKVYRA